ncbi:MAG: ABC-2 family transporter protein [Clostridiales bacterium]|nr:ABC-2 family transporter protein [Roseburia sp.]MDD7638573.1 ABC-2 family transporter protein [Clostridiales bacterium]MDY4111474.1 ABC-2 family transporter protein [Roseburia sp.]
MKQRVVDIKKHISFMKIAKINKKVFIPNYFNELVVLPIRFLILCIIWYAIYRVIETDEINGYSLWGMILYYFVYAAIMHITTYYRQLPYTVWNEITRGEMSKFICRPVSYIKYHFFYGLGYTYYSMLICIPLTIITSLYYYHGLDYVVHVLLFIISVLLGAAVTFYVHILIGFLTFWTESVFGYRDFILHLGAIFSGGIIPLTFLPVFLQKISLFLPFRYMIYEPICILFGNYSMVNICAVIVSQILCIIVLGIVTGIVWSLGIRRYEAQGG